MQQNSVLLCRAASCRTVLGDVRGGRLRPHTADVELGPDGTAILRCPACGVERLWVPRANAPVDDPRS